MGRGLERGCDGEHLNLQNTYNCKICIYDTTLCLRALGENDVFYQNTLMEYSLRQVFPYVFSTTNRHRFSVIVLRV